MRAGSDPMKGTGIPARCVTVDRPRHLAAAGLLLALGTAGCRGGGDTSSPAPLAPGFLVTSRAAGPDGRLARDFTCDGSGHPPDLAWTGAPAGTRSFVLFVHDPDAPTGDFAHWVLANIPAGVTALPTGASAGTPGLNDFGTPGYGPPCPPSGSHRYIFAVVALDIPAVELPAGFKREQLQDAIRGHSLGRAELVARYSRR